MDKSGEYDFLNDLVRFDSLAELERIISEYCEKSFYAQTVTLISFQRDTKPITLLSHILDRDLAEFFTTYYARIGFMLDPFYIVAFGEAEFTAHQLREIAPDKFKTSEYYAQYYAKTGLVDELGATIRLGPRIALHLSLGRLGGHGRFRANELRYFKQLSPIILNRLKAILKDPVDVPEMSNAPDLIERYQNMSEPSRSGLSRREAEIAALIVQGHSSRAAGLQLGISDQTVKVHRRNIYRKLQISSQNELFSLLVQDIRGG